MTEPRDTDAEKEVLLVDECAAILSTPPGKPNLLADKLAEIAWRGRKNFSVRLLSDGTELWRTIPSRTPAAWKALLEQSTPDDEPTL